MPAEDLLSQDGAIQAAIAQKRFGNRGEQVAKGQDIVEGLTPDREKRAAPFDRKGLQEVRSWTRSRPLEPTSPAAALVEYPRMWTTKRGRYSKFRIPGAGTYGLLRARPTF